MIENQRDAYKWLVNYLGFKFPELGWKIKTDETGDFVEGSTYYSVYDKVEFYVYLTSSDGPDNFFQRFQLSIMHHCETWSFSRYSENIVMRDSEDLDSFVTRAMKDSKFRIFTSNLRELKDAIKEK